MDGDDGQAARGGTRAYVVRRLLLLIPTLFGITLFAFAVSHLAPGDPARERLRRMAPDRPPTRAEVARERHELGLDRPVTAQYLAWLGGAIRGDLGESYVTRRQVADELATRIPATLALVVPASALALLIAIPSGILAAVHHGRLTDHALRVASLVGACLPSFWLALVLIVVFAVKLSLFPVSGRGGLSSMVLPVVTMAVAPAAVLARFTRAAMLETLDEDYVRSARARGLRERVVVWRHALRNALVPVVTVFGVIVGGLAVGDVIVESIFLWPGVGRLAIEAVQARDYPMIAGFVVYGGVAFAAINLVVDLVYSVIDPRVRMAASA
ncbi:MAG: ABC transporter permease [Actinomycetota bacterium]|nr:ABC transporter permease [Actinomycetota bacterium]